MKHNRTSHHLPLWARTLSLLLPRAEREEVQGDLVDEFQQRKRTSQHPKIWLARQIITSVPPLLQRTIWRGSNGFEPSSSRYQPGGSLVERWIIDTRFAIRHLRSRPLYTGLWILTLALGVGGTAAIAAILSAFFLNPLPYPDETELVAFWNPYDWSEAEHVFLRPDYTPFDAVAAYRHEPVTLRQGEAPARLVQGIASSAELFDVLNVAPQIGRTFNAGEDLHSGSPSVVVLSHRLWEQLGANTNTVGNMLEFDGNKMEVVGVMPPGFWFPDPAVDVWMTTPLDPNNRSGNYAMVGRLHNGTSTATRDAGVTAIAERLAERFEYPIEWDKTINPSVIPLREDLLGSARSTLLATQAAMIAILLMAAANVGALMLGQLDSRSHDLALRLALGAPRRRIAGQFFIEASILGLLAGIVGTAFAVVSFEILRSTMPLGQFGGTVVADLWLPVFALLLSLSMSFLIATLPVLGLLKAKGLGNVNGRGRGSLGERGGKLEGALVISEIAVAVLLVAAAGLLLRSASNLRAIHTGIDTSQVTVLTISSPTGEDNAASLRLLRRLSTELSTLPGVDSAAAVQRLPLSGGGWSTGLKIEHREDLEGVTTFYRMITEDYFATLGIKLLGGRAFRLGDAEGEEPLVVINRALANRYFADQDPIGRRISHGMTRWANWARIIGVVDNEAVAGLRDEPAPARYMLYDHIGFTPESNGFVLRTKEGTAPSIILPLAQSLIERSAPQVAIEDSMTMEDLLTTAMGATPQLTRLLALLSALALALGMIGVYGVINHFVAKRSQEWSLRLALGLGPTDIIRLVLGRGAVLIALGILVGLAATRLLAGTLSSLLYGVADSDAGALLFACVALAITGIIAAFLPAWRAGRSNPATLLSRAP